MTAQQILREIRRIGGRLEARGDRLRVDAPAGTLTPELKAAIAENKQGILAKLSGSNGPSDASEFDASVNRREAAKTCIAIFITETDAGFCVIDREIRSDAEARQAVTEDAVIYTPADMYHYIQLEPHERRMLHEFKRLFGGTTEWK